MIYLALSILCSTLIVLIFRAFPKYNVQSFQAIVVNYATCSTLGLLMTTTAQVKSIPQWSGLGLSVFLGACFISLFYLIARTTQVLGVATASVAQKISFIVPVLAGILYFQDDYNFLKIIGVILGILSVFLITFKESEGDEPHPIDGNWWMPLVVFLGSGLCDLIVKIIQTNHIDVITEATFTLVLFFTAFVIGCLRLITSKTQFESKSVLAGIVLGIPNFGSIYFLVLALKHSGLDSAQVFPINNIGIILLATVAAWMFYKEVLDKRQIAGLLIAITSIFILI